ncbi:MAG: hypothetical protein ABIP51_08760 [Bacteroidia bacterium]
MKKALNKNNSISNKLAIDLNAFFGKEVIENVGELFEQLHQPFLFGTQLEINLRNLNNWKTVLASKENLTTKRFTFSEFIWYKIVEQLREAGLSLPIILKFKENFLQPIKAKQIIAKAQEAKNYIEDLKLSRDQKEQLTKFLASPEYKNTIDNLSFTLLDIIITESTLKRLPLSLAVFLDGEFIIIDKTKEQFYTEEDKNRLLFDTYITVSVTSIFNKFLRSDLSDYVVPKLGLLSYAENKLFEVVHSGDYESITIHFKDKKIKALELKKSENIKDRIIDILNSGEFGEFIIKKHKNQITKIENTQKITL